MMRLSSNDKIKITIIVYTDEVTKKDDRVRLVRGSVINKVGEYD